MFTKENLSKIADHLHAQKFNHNNSFMKERYDVVTQEILKFPTKQTYLQWIAVWIETYKEMTTFARKDKWVPWTRPQRNAMMHLRTLAKNQARQLRQIKQQEI